MKNAVLSLVLLFAATTVCDAGGGNSKSNGSIRFTNTSTTQIGLVVVDPSTSLTQATNAAQFTARGGRILLPGESTTFKNLKAGSHAIGTALVAPGTTAVDVSAFNRRNVTVSNGNTTQVNL
jgi:hypothetical protein